MAERKELGKLAGQRQVFTGRFERFGIKSSFRGPPKETLLLRDVRTTEGKLVTDHLWFNMTVEFEMAALSPGDVVQFTARVTRYTKGYMGRRDDVWTPIESDWKLSRPTKVEVIELATDNGQAQSHQRDSDGALMVRSCKWCGSPDHIGLNCPERPSQQKENKRPD